MTFENPDDAKDALEGMNGKVRYRVLRFKSGAGVLARLVSRFISLGSMIRTDSTASFYDSARFNNYTTKFKLCKC